MIMEHFGGVGLTSQSVNWNINDGFSEENPSRYNVKFDKNDVEKNYGQVFKVKRKIRANNQPLDSVDLRAPSSSISMRPSFEP